MGVGKGARAQEVMERSPHEAGNTSKLAKEHQRVDTMKGSVGVICGIWDFKGIRIN